MRSSILLASTIYCIANACTVCADASLYANHWHHDYRPYKTTSNKARIICSRKFLETGEGINSSQQYVVVPAVRNKRNNIVISTRLRPKQETLLSGTIRVLADALEDYIVGFCVGYTIGVIVGLPKSVFTPNGAGSTGSWLHARSLPWALSTGEFLGTFRGCATATRLIRHPRGDNWNIVYGCASCGAILSRNQGPVGMATTALIWGAIVYLLEYKTSFRPISRHRENDISPFRTGNRRSRFF